MTPHFISTAASVPPNSKARCRTAALTEAGVEHVIEWYPAGHGFAVPDNGPYEQQAAERHWQAMEAFFGEHLA